MGLDGESYSLTQNPGLLTWPADAGVAPLSIDNSLTVFPNPTSGIVNITFDATTDQLQEVAITNILGQEVKNVDIPAPQKNNYSFDLSGMVKGIYFVKCNFVSGSSVTRKILLQ